MTGNECARLGYVAPGWTLLNLPGWRALSSDSLGAAIESALRRGDRSGRGTFTLPRRGRRHSTGAHGRRRAVGTLTHLDRGRRRLAAVALGPGRRGAARLAAARQRRMRRRRCPRAETCVAAPRLDCAHGSGAHTASIRRRSGRQPGGAARRRTRSRATAAARSCGRHDTRHRVRAGARSPWWPAHARRLASPLNAEIAARDLAW